ncbi:MAG: alpha/beta hydrolase, partial [Oscillospiraceae bacterium]|nr:alpha/beta hydrolase [Oscillospiraceae bacterium]
MNDSFDRFITLGGGLMFVDAGGVNVYYEQAGQTGPPVLLLHGWGCDVSLWRPIIDRLATRCRVTAVDLPGHGKS